MSLSDAFVAQAGHCAALGSPFMARLMTLFAERLVRGHPVADHVLDWPGDAGPMAESVPLRLAGALHALRLDGLALEDVYPPNEVDDDRLWAAVDGAMRDHAPRLIDWLASAPQTNEVRRAAAVLPGLAYLKARHDMPVALFELGASGGLNLRMDRFCLDAGDSVLGDQESAVRLAPEWRGAAPLSDLPDVVARAGVDLNPIDPASDAGRLRLLAYLWPDQPDRLARTDAAISLAARHPATVDTGDAAGWLERALATPMPGVLRVVYHTIAWQYFPDDTAARALVAMERAGGDGPVARLSVEGDGGTGAAVTVTLWPGGETVELARADFHGRWIDWHPPAG